MKTLLLMIAKLFSRTDARSNDERYLAQAVDAQDLEIRLRALQRARP